MLTHYLTEFREIILEITDNCLRMGVRVYVRIRGARSLDKLNSVWSRMYLIIKSHRKLRALMKEQRDAATAIIALR